MFWSNVSEKIGPVEVPCTREGWWMKKSMPCSSTASSDRGNAICQPVRHCDQEGSRADPTNQDNIKCPGQWMNAHIGPIELPSTREWWLMNNWMPLSSTASSDQGNAGCQPCNHYDQRRIKGGFNQGTMTPKRWTLHIMVTPYNPYAIGIFKSEAHLFEVLGNVLLGLHMVHLLLGQIFCARGLELTHQHVQ